MRIRILTALSVVFMLWLAFPGEMASKPTCYQCGDQRCTTASSGYQYCNAGPSGCMAWGICPD